MRASTPLTLALATAALFMMPEAPYSIGGRRSGQVACFQTSTAPTSIGLTIASSCTRRRTGPTCRPRSIRVVVELRTRPGRVHSLGKTLQRSSPGSSTGHTGRPSQWEAKPGVGGGAQQLAATPRSWTEHWRSEGSTGSERDISGSSGRQRVRALVSASGCTDGTIFPIHPPGTSSSSSISSAMHAVGRRPNGRAARRG